MKKEQSRLKVHACDAASYSAAFRERARTVREAREAREAVERPNKKRKSSARVPGGGHRPRLPDGDISQAEARELLPPRLLDLEESHRGRLVRPFEGPPAGLRELVQIRRREGQYDCDPPQCVEGPPTEHRLRRRGLPRLRPFRCGATGSREEHRQVQPMVNSFLRQPLEPASFFCLCDGPRRLLPQATCWHLQQQSLLAMSSRHSKPPKRCRRSLAHM